MSKSSRFPLVTQLIPTSGDVTKRVLKCVLRDTIGEGYEDHHANISLNYILIHTVCVIKNTGWLVFEGKKDKTTPITDLLGPEGSALLRLQITRHSVHEGGKVVTLTHRPPLPPGISWYSFLEAESTPGHTEMSADAE